MPRFAYEQRVDPHAVFRARDADEFKDRLQDYRDAELGRLVMAEIQPGRRYAIERHTESQRDYFLRCDVIRDSVEVWPTQQNRTVLMQPPKFQPEPPTIWDAARKLLPWAAEPISRIEEIWK